MTRSSWKRVKNLRVVVALTFLTLFTILFIDAWHLVPHEVTTVLTSFQLVPAILKAVFVGGAVTIAGVATIIVMTLLFGRVYCSTLCPLGILQDIIIRFARKVNKRKRFRYMKAPRWLHYSILAVSIVLLLFGSSMIIGDLLEPFSNYGRIVNAFVLPLVILVNNVVSDILTRGGVFFLYTVPLHVEGIGALLLGLLFFVTIAYLSVNEGRLFCNSFCPAGAILSLISKISLYKLVIVENACNDCGACDKVCKAECIDSSKKHIDFSACVGCFNCLRSCPKDAIKYEKRSISDIMTSDVDFDYDRRKFFKDLTIPAVTFLAVPGLVKGGGVIVGEKEPIVPPGSLSIYHFTSVCTACHLCVTSCPTGVLQPSLLEYGFAGMFQPKMDYSVNYCNYDCVTCGTVCPTGAIIPLDLATKKLVQIGKSVFHKDDCIVVSKKKDCAACSEHCPTKAVHTVPYENGLFIPEIDSELCIGCGACEYACPVTPNKAITVTANPVHLKAKKPKVEKAKPSPATTPEAFPF